MTSDPDFWGYFVGWLGVLFGLGVAPPQLYKLWKSKSGNDISILTYVMLCLALVFYLLHAIWIHSIIFIAAQAINLVVNSMILIHLIYRR